MIESVPPIQTDHSLAGRVREGSEGAAAALHARYAQRLVALARKKCGADLTARADAEDFVQSAFASYFRGARAGRYDLPTGEELWGLLLVITLNKVRAKGEYHRAAKRDVRRTEGVTDRFDPPDDDDAAATILRLTVEDVLSGVPPEFREVVRMRMDGFEMAEIAERTGRAKRSVERILQTFRRAMADALGERTE